MNGKFDRLTVDMNGHLTRIWQKLEVIGDRATTNKLDIKWLLTALGWLGTIGLVIWKG